ncbi:MAG: Na/Pi symporter [Gammaproteobacteria bacterium]|nr:Na/Pi symporter [Gammaproteobacteria bacterium]MDE0415076.1 Na/Pi symporter [Gammaproteobacteria bacterium]
MSDSLAGLVGGLGLFIAGMWLLTANLKTLADYRLRRAVNRWTGNRYSALLCGCVAGGVTQNMTALTFITVGVLRAGMISTAGALAVILGGCIGSSLLVLIVTLDVKVLALVLVGIFGIAAASETLTKHRTLAASLFGGSLLLFGLTLLQDYAAPIAAQAWFQAILEYTGRSMELAFVVAAMLTFVIQSPNAICILGIGLLGAGALTVEQTLMVFYGAGIGSGALLYLLSSGISGRARRIAMYMVLYDILTSAVLVPLLYVELHLGVPLAMALLERLPFAEEINLAIFYILISLLALPLLLGSIDLCAAALKRRWPSSLSDALARPRFIQDTGAGEDPLARVRREHARVVQNFAVYFDAVREGRLVAPLREASCSLIDDIGGFLEALPLRRNAHEVEARNALRNQHRLLLALEAALGDLCTLLGARAPAPQLRSLHAGVLEGVDALLHAVIRALDKGKGDAAGWRLVARAGEDHAQRVRRIRARYLDADPPLSQPAVGEMLRLSEAAEEALRVLFELEPAFARKPG